MIVGFVCCDFCEYCGVVCDVLGECYELFVV